MIIGLSVLYILGVILWFFQIVSQVNDEGYHISVSMIAGLILALFWPIFWLAYYIQKPISSS